MHSTPFSPATIVALRTANLTDFAKSAISPNPF